MCALREEEQRSACTDDESEGMKKHNWHAGAWVADHAIGLVVDEGKSMLYDNGFTGGIKDVTMKNMAGRMIDISACFVFDFIEMSKCKIK